MKAKNDRQSLPDHTTGAKTPKNAVGRDGGKAPMMQKMSSIQRMGKGKAGKK